MKKLILLFASVLIFNNIYAQTPKNIGEKWSCAPTIISSIPSDICQNSEPISLKELIKIEGHKGGSITITGNGVAGNTLFPAILHDGAHEIHIHYVYGTKKVSQTEIITIHSSPAIILELEKSEVSINEKIFTLSGGLPKKGMHTSVAGVYYGSGVNPTTGMFNPKIAGKGTHWIEYVYTDLYGCTASTSDKIIVK